MKKILIILSANFILASSSQAQMEPKAGKWKTWFISSGKEYRLPPPASYKNEVTQVLQRQQELDSAGRQQILYWNAGSSGYRWQELISKFWMTDTSSAGVLSNMLLGAATYDATIAAWDTKYAYNRPRPFVADSRIKVLVPKPESPSYPCEHSVAAGVAVVIFKKYYPRLADSVNRLAQQMMDSRIAAGVAFPSDTRAGFELGRLIAEKEIESTKHFLYTGGWDGKRPNGPGLWQGRPMFPVAGKNKTVLLDSSSQFRPGPPPDFAKEMDEIRKFKSNFRSMANAFYFASPPPGDDPLHKKMLEYNVHLNPPRAARLYAITAIAYYDAFIACWDAKYAYWGTRPDQYDTTYRPVILHTPPFPGYPSGHAVMSGVQGDLYSYLFPGDAAYFQKRAKDGAESRFQAGIHFRTDNEVGLDLGRKIAAVAIQKLKNDGADKVLDSNAKK